MKCETEASFLFVMTIRKLDVLLSFRGRRDRLGHEVDFLVTRDRKPWMLVECKKGADRNFGRMRYFAEKLAVQACFQVTRDESDYLDRDTGVRMIPASRFLTALV